MGMDKRGIQSKKKEQVMCSGVMEKICDIPFYICSMF